MAAAEHRSDLLEVGRVLRSHGVRGELKMLPETDDPERLLDLSCVFLGDSENLATSYEVKSARLQRTKKGVLVLLTLKGVDGRDAADALQKKSVYASREELPPLDEGEYFLFEVIGSQVFTGDGEPVGELKDIIETPAHNIFVISRPGQKDALVPAVPEFIESIDVDTQRVVIQPVEGLLDV